MGSDFFKAGGMGMYPTLLFGFLLVASAALFLLRQERRYLSLMVSLGITTLGSGLLSFCMGLVNTFRYLEQVPPPDQLKIAALGCEESLHNVVLALILLVLGASIASAGCFRAVRAPGLSPKAT
jgi:hypothetical protein